MADGTVVQSLKIKIDVENNATKSLNGLKKRFEEIATASKSLENTGNGAILKINNLSLALAKLSSLKTIPKTLPERLGQLAEVAKNMSNVDTKAFKDMVSSISMLKDVGTINLGGIANKQGGLGGTVNDTFPDKTIQGGESSHITDQADNVKKVTIEWKKYASALGRASVSYSKFILGASVSPFRALGRAISNVTSKIGGFINSLKRIAFYRSIRKIIKEITQAFKEGMENLYQYSKVTGTDFAKSMDMIATSLLYLKNSIGAMAAPIVNVLAPAIDFAIDKFVALLNVVNEAIAALTGAGTWTKAIKYPTEYAEGVNDAAGANKKFKATILGIDEINPLKDNSSGGGGSGSNALDYSKMFEEMETSSSSIGHKIKAFAKEIKDAWDNEDMSSVGETIGNAISNGLNSINWDSIRSRNAKIFTNIATLINGLIETPELADSIGKTMAEMLNTAVSTLSTFVNTVHWESIGKFIGEGLSSFFKDVKWNSVGTVIHDTVVGMTSLISSALDNLDTKAVAKGISEFFKGLDVLDIASALAKTLISIIKSSFSVVGELMISDPATFNILAIGVGIKTGLVGSIAKSLGSGGSSSDAVSTGLMTPFKNAFKNLKGFLTSDINLAGNSLATTLGQAFVLAATAYEGFELGQYLYYKSETVQKIADGLVEAITPYVDPDYHSDVEKQDALYEVVEELQRVYQGLDKANGAAKDIIENALNISGKSIKEFLADFDEESFINLGIDATDLYKELRTMGYTSQDLSEFGKKWLPNVLDVENEIKFKANVKDAIKGVQQYRTSVNGIPTNVPTYANFYDDQTGASRKVKNYVSLIGGIPSNVPSYAVFNSDGKAVGYKATIDSLQTTKTTTVYAETDGANTNVNSYKTNLDSKVPGSKNTNITVTSPSSETIQQIAKSMYNDLANIFNAGVDKSKSGANGMPSVIADMMKLSTFASGGFPDMGELFIANEAGAELVGQIGNKTAVANSDQIVSAVASGVASANASQNALLREQNNILMRLLNKDTSAVISTSSIVNGLNRANRRDGNTIVPVG